jgi:hypothetical protein
MTIPDTTDLAAQLDDSASVTLYTDIPGLDPAGAQGMAAADPPLDVAWDYVRQQWAVQAVAEPVVLSS